MSADPQVYAYLQVTAHRNILSDSGSMNLNRRQFCAALAGSALAAQSARPLIDRGFATVEKLADGVYVTIAHPDKGPQCLSNGGILVGRERTLLVEGHFQPAGAALEIEAAGVALESSHPRRGEYSFSSGSYLRQSRLRGPEHSDHGPRPRARADEGAVRQSEGR